MERLFWWISAGGDCDLAIFRGRDCRKAIFRKSRRRESNLRLRRIDALIQPSLLNRSSSSEKVKTRLRPQSRNGSVTKNGLLLCGNPSRKQRIRCSPMMSSWCGILSRRSESFQTSSPWRWKVAPRKTLQFNDENSLFRLGMPGQFFYGRKKHLMLSYYINIMRKWGCG